MRSTRPLWRPDLHPHITDHAIDQFRERIAAVEPWTARAVLRDLAARALGRHGRHHSVYHGVPITIVLRQGAVITVWSE